MKNIFILLLTYSILGLQSCSSRNAFEAANSSNELECRKLPPAEYEDCIKSYEKDYDRYQQQREEVIKDRY